MPNANEALLVFAIRLPAITYIHTLNSNDVTRLDLEEIEQVDDVCLLVNNLHQPKVFRNNSMDSVLDNDCNQGKNLRKFPFIFASRWAMVRAYFFQATTLSE